MTGLEPARAQCPLEPESSASASSATSAQLSVLDYNNVSKENCQHFFLKYFAEIYSFSEKKKARMLQVGRGFKFSSWLLQTV